MNLKREWKTLLAILSVFLGFYFLPLESGRFNNAWMEALYLTKWYAREHVVLCLVPAFFIAGAIGAFVRQSSVMKYFGAKANKFLAYGVSSVSGSILAVCSCTVLPLFAGIYRMGAGLGPATAFLYSGPAINVLAIIFTAKVLGFKLGLARAVGAILFSVVIGLSMETIFRKEELAKAKAQMALPDPEISRPLWQNFLFFGSLVAILIFANLGPSDHEVGLAHILYSYKWGLTLISFMAMLAVLFMMKLRKAEANDWFSQTWDFAKQILPLLLIGILIAGFLLGRPGREGIIPSAWVSSAVGGNSLLSNFIASFAGAFMYFATLTEVPILQGLIGNGMGQGPALALLLAGPALSLPNMLVIRSVMGTRKTVVYILLVIIMATLTGLIYGKFA